MFTITHLKTASDAAYYVERRLIKRHNLSEPDAWRFANMASLSAADCGGAITVMTDGIVMFHAPATLRNEVVETITIEREGDYYGLTTGYKVVTEWASDDDD